MVIMRGIILKLVDVRIDRSKACFVLDDWRMFNLSQAIEKKSQIDSDILIDSNTTAGTIFDTMLLRLDLAFLAVLDMVAGRAHECAHFVHADAALESFCHRCGHHFQLPGP